jgi:hypothetical protein
MNVLFSLAHKVHRVVAQPPEDQRDGFRKLVDALYKIDAPYHKRAAGKESDLVQDLKMMCSVPLYGGGGHNFGSVEGATRVHYCWDFETNGPCCLSDEDCRDKVALGHVNFHGSTAFERPSLARFTHVGMARKRVILAMGSQRLAIQAYVVCCTKVLTTNSAGEVVIPDIVVEEAGSREEDRAATTAKRCKKLTSWFTAPSTYYRLPIAEATEAILDDFQYEFFGRDRSSIAAETLLNPASSPIRSVLSSIWACVTSWPPAADGPWSVLFLVGWRDFTSQDVLRCARSHALGIMAMLNQKYDRRFSDLPWLLARLADPTTPEAEKVIIAQLLVRLLETRRCCVPLFGREFASMYPTVPQMLSAAAAGTIRVWLKGKRFSTKASELGHALERQALSAASAPGKTFAPHSERDFMNRHRLSHVVRNGRDPAGLLKLRGVPRGALGENCVCVRTHARLGTLEHCNVHACMFTHVHR